MPSGVPWFAPRRSSTTDANASSGAAAARVELLPRRDRAQPGGVHRGRGGDAGRGRAPRATARRRTDGAADGAARRGGRHARLRLARERRRAVQLAAPLAVVRSARLVVRSDAAARREPGELRGVARAGLRWSLPYAVGSVPWLRFHDPSHFFWSGIGALSRATLEAFAARSAEGSPAHSAAPRWAWGIAAMGCVRSSTAVRRMWRFALVRTRSRVI